MGSSQGIDGTYSGCIGRFFRTAVTWNGTHADQFASLKGDLTTDEQQISDQFGGYVAGDGLGCFWKDYAERFELLSNSRHIDGIPAAKELNILTCA